MPGTNEEDYLLYVFGDKAAEYIEAALNGGILLQDQNGNIRFRHELSRLAILERLNMTTRRRYHQTILDKLKCKGRTVPVDQIVQHAAGAMDAETVLKHAPIAAELAAKAGAHREAAMHLATAMRFIDQADTGVAARLNELWATEASLTSRVDDEVIEARRHAITLFKALTQMDKVGENLRLLSRLHWQRGEALEADRASEQAIEILEGIAPSAQRAMAYSLRSQLFMLNDKMDEAVLWGKRALALERTFTDLTLRIHALNNVGTALVFRGSMEGLPMLEESLKLAISNDQHEDAARAYVNISEFALEFRQFNFADKTINEGITYNTQHDLDSWTQYMYGRLAQLRLDQGHLHEACTISQAIVENRKLSLLMRLPALQVLARAHMRLDSKESTGFMLAALEDALSTNELQNIVPARLTIIEATWLKGDYATGKIHLDSLLELGNADRHQWNIGELNIWRQRFFSPSSINTSQHCSNKQLPEPYRLELHGDYQGAANKWLALGLPHCAALSLLASNTADCMPQCAALFLSLDAQAGLKSLAAKVKQHDLRSPSLSTRKRYKTKSTQHPLGLTSKERKIVTLLAKGLNNKEISSELIRSVRTVENHVASILNKLNAPNRMAVILRVQNEPWLLESED
jgi:DNA-binding CsgD family transcriptional regulator